MIYKGPKLLRNASAIKKRKAVFHWDWLTCACHNDAMLFGFSIADKKGDALKNQYSVRRPTHYLCNHCGAVITAPKGFPFRTERVVKVVVKKFASKAQRQRADDICNS